MPGDHSSLSVSTGTGIFLYSRKNELFAAAIKTVFSKWETLSLKMKNHENTSVYFEDS